MPPPPGEIERFARGDAAELFVLALNQLTQRFGVPDFPNLVPHRTPREGEDPTAVWDFDYYSVELRVVSAQLASWRVELQRKKP